MNIGLLIMGEYEYVWLDREGFPRDVENHGGVLHDMSVLPRDLW
jgi:hypothetical protein